MSTPLRYLVDEHVAKAVGSGSWKRGIDVVTIAEVGRLGAEDEDLPAVAEEEGRVMVTRDRDVLRLAAQMSGDHPGVVYAPQGRSIGELVRRLDLLAQVSNTEESLGWVEYGRPECSSSLPQNHPLLRNLG